jgi:hypothetical protein
LDTFHKSQKASLPPSLSHPLKDILLPDNNENTQSIDKDNNDLPIKSSTLPSIEKDDSSALSLGIDFSVPATPLNNVNPSLLINLFSTFPSDSLSKMIFSSSPFSNYDTTSPQTFLTKESSLQIFQVFSSNGVSLKILPSSDEKEDENNTTLQFSPSSSNVDFESQNNDDKKILLESTQLLLKLMEDYLSSSTDISSDIVVEGVSDEDRNDGGEIRKGDDDEKFEEDGKLDDDIENERNALKYVIEDNVDELRKQNNNESNSFPDIDGKRKRLREEDVEIEEKDSDDELENPESSTSDISVGGFVKGDHSKDLTLEEKKISKKSDELFSRYYSKQFFLKISLLQHTLFRILHRFFSFSIQYNNNYDVDEAIVPSIKKIAFAMQILKPSTLPVPIEQKSNFFSSTNSFYVGNLNLHSLSPSSFFNKLPFVSSDIPFSFDNSPNIHVHSLIYTLCKGASQLPLTSSFCISFLHYIIANYNSSSPFLSSQRKQWYYGVRSVLALEWLKLEFSNAINNNGNTNLNDLFCFNADFENVFNLNSKNKISFDLFKEMENSFFNNFKMKNSISDLLNDDNLFPLLLQASNENSNPNFISISSVSFVKMMLILKPKTLFLNLKLLSSVIITSSAKNENTKYSKLLSQFLHERLQNRYNVILSLLLHCWSASLPSFHENNFDWFYICLFLIHIFFFCTLGMKLKGLVDILVKRQ